MTLAYKSSGRGFEAGIEQFFASVLGWPETHVLRCLFRNLSGHFKFYIEFWMRSVANQFFSQLRDLILFASKKRAEHITLQNSSQQNAAPNRKRAL